MGFVDEIYEMYKSHLKADDDYLITLVLNLLHNHKSEEILDKINEMKDYEVYQMFSIYLIEALKVKIAEEDIHMIKTEQNPPDSKFH